MAGSKVKFDKSSEAVTVPAGSLITEAARLAGVDIIQPCGGQGRCGRCAVLVESGSVRRRSALRLSERDIQQGYALACQTVIEGDALIDVPPQEKIVRRLTTDRLVADIQVPEGYEAQNDQSMHRLSFKLTPPNMEDQTDDASRLKTEFRRRFGYEDVYISLNQYRRIGYILRQGNWQISAVLDIQMHPHST